MDDNDPIRNEETFLSKIFKKFVKKFKKTKPKDYEQILKQVQINTRKNYEAYSKFGMSCEEASKNLQKMGKAFAAYNQILTPNQMREIINRNNETTLYADGEPYCILNEKGDPVWQRKEK